MRTKEFRLTLIALAIFLFTLLYFYLSIVNVKLFPSPMLAESSLFDGFIVILIMIASGSILWAFRTLEPKKAYWGILGYLLFVGLTFAYIYNEIQSLRQSGFSLPIPPAIFAGTILTLLLAIICIIFRPQILKILTHIITSLDETKNSQYHREPFVKQEKSYQSEIAVHVVNGQEHVKDYNQPEASYPLIVQEQQYREK